MSNDDRKANVTPKQGALAWIYDILNARLVVAALFFFLVGSLSTLPLMGSGEPDRTEVLMQEIAVELKAIRGELEMQNRIQWEESRHERYENFEDWKARHAHRAAGGTLAGR